jgi:plastocyanin
MRPTRFLAAEAVVLLLAACGGQAPSQEQQVAPAAGTGEIRGTVRLRGAAPVSRTETNTKNPEVCGTTVPVTRLLTGPDGGVGAAFVYLDGIDAAGPLRPAATVTVEQKGCVYGPHSMVASAGAPVEIVNDDPVLHNVHASAMLENEKKTIFNIAQPVRGQRTRIESTLKPGIITLTCEAGHPWMTAHMLVTNHGFAAVSDDRGSFVISGVPAGTYPVKMWHEGIALTRIVPSLQLFEYEAPYEVTKQVVVTAGQTSKVDFELELRGQPEQSALTIPASLHP